MTKTVDSEWMANAKRMIEHNEWSFEQDALKEAVAEIERLRAALRAIADSAECPELPAMAAEALRGSHEPEKAAGNDYWPTKVETFRRENERLRETLRKIYKEAEQEWSSNAQVMSLCDEALEESPSEPDGDLSTRYAVERGLTAKYEGALMSVISTESLSYAKDVAKVAMGVGRKAPERCIRCGLTRVEHDNPDEFQPAVKSGEEHG